MKGLESFDSNANRRQVNDREAIEITSSLKSLMNMIKTSSQESITPLLFLATLRKHYPHFGERDPQSQAPMQQDANECWTLIMRSMQAIMNSKATEQQNNLIDQYRA